MIYFAARAFVVMNLTGSIDLKEIAVDAGVKEIAIDVDADVKEIAADAEEIVGVNADAKEIAVIYASAEGVAICAIIADRAAATQGHAIIDAASGWALAAV